MAHYEVIGFDQYGSDDPDDDLLMFAAPAEAIWGWAGIPRKGWQLRMLYQRWITRSREQEVTTFWNEASTRREDQPKKYLVGPTALTIAIADSPEIKDGKISLEYEKPFKATDPSEVQLQAGANTVLERMTLRLDEDGKARVKAITEDPKQDLPDFDHDYVLESLCQIAVAKADPEYFIDHNGLSEDDVSELIQSLEALCRPALVVDGQHRLYGAAHAERPIVLPVVAIPKSPWMEQIYQFVVINEKAQRVETSLLTDIFGSSLTPAEQRAIRLQLQRSRVDVEERIAAVVAARDQESPFFDLVKIKLEGEPPSGVEPFIPDATIRQLIEGGRGARGWRSDEEFYNYYVKPTFPNQADWETWADGAWRRYWFAFWSVVRDFYNEEADDPLWHDGGQSNLTKAVTLRLFQTLFMEKATQRIKDVERMRPIMVDTLGGDEEAANEKIIELIADKCLPETVEEFEEQVRLWFLKKGVPVRVFTKAWVSSLDDAQGQRDLYDELEKAFDSTQANKRYRASNTAVFSSGE